MVKTCLQTLCIVALVHCAAAPARSAEVLVNGGFESPDISGGSGFLTVFAGDPALAPWVVSMVSVDLYNQASVFSLGSAYEGAQYVDLNGSAVNGMAPGQITQTFATSPLTIYQYSFVYANNYQVGPQPKSAEVRVFDTSSSVDLFAPIDVSHGSSTATNLDWTLFTGFFVAIDSTTSIQFTSLDPTSASGILLDAVSVVTVESVKPIPETSTVVSGILVCAVLIGCAVRRRSAQKLEACASRRS